MKFFPKIFIILFLLNICACTHKKNEDDRTDQQTSGIWVVGYYVGYQRNLYPINNVNFSALTHLAVGRVEPQNNGTLTNHFDIDNVNGPLFAQAAVDAAHNAGKKTILMVGGAGEHDGFVASARNALRSTFVSNLLAVMDQYGFDGLDIDWEPITDADKPDLKQLIMDLRNARPSMLLTLPVGWINSNFNTLDSFYSEVEPYLDRFDIMSYHMIWISEGWWSWHSSALYGHKYNTPSSIDACVQAYLDAGIPANKLSIGIGFFGVCYENIYWQNNGWVKSANRVTGPNQNTDQATVRYSDNHISYSNIMRYFYSGNNYNWGETARVPYLSFIPEKKVENLDGRSWVDIETSYISYENAESIKEKGSYVKANGLGGVIIWTIGQGYLGWKSNGEKDPLMKALKEGFLD